MMDQLVQRMIRAAKLEPGLYEEVEADTGALGQAAIVVVLSSLAGGLGAAQLTGSAGVVATTIASLLGWGVWATVIYVIGAKLLPEPQTEADVGELMRTIGFSASPGLLRVFGLVPVIGVLALLVSSLWMLASMVVAVRQALDYTGTGRAVVVCLIGFFVQMVVIAVLLGPIAAR